MGDEVKAGSGKRLRVWEQWEGKEVFFFDGRIMAGPNWRAPFGSALLIIAPTAVFLAFPATYLMINLHPVVMVFSCLLPVLSLIFLFMTAFRDPGVIPRQEPDDEYLAGRKPRSIEVLVNNHRVVIRYNDTCHFYQPPRAHHCSVNDNCIERFDHHCPWVGTTIGKRNYRTFLLFVYTTTVLCLYVMGCCLAQLFMVHNQAVAEGSSPADPWGPYTKDIIPALVLLGFTFLFVWFVGGLSAFHGYLVGTNQTTYENFRYNHDDRPNPYDLGLWRNCAEVWCVPIPPSQVNFRAWADEEQEKQRARAAAASADAAGNAGAGAGNSAHAQGGGGYDEEDPDPDTSHEGNGAQHLDQDLSRVSSDDGYGQGQGHGQGQYEYQQGQYGQAQGHYSDGGDGNNPSPSPHQAGGLAHNYSAHDSDFVTPHSSQQVTGGSYRPDGTSGHAGSSIAHAGSGISVGTAHMQGLYDADRMGSAASASPRYGASPVATQGRGPGSPAARAGSTGAASNGSPMHQAPPQQQWQGGSPGPVWTGNAANAAGGGGAGKVVQPSEVQLGIHSPRAVSGRPQAGPI